MPSDWKESAIEHKYAPLPDEGPRHMKSKAKPSPTKQGKHAHEWEDVVVCTYQYGVDEERHYPPSTCSRFKLMRRCTLCGKFDKFVNSADLPAECHADHIDGTWHNFTTDEVAEHPTLRWALRELPVYHVGDAWVWDMNTDEVANIDPDESVAEQLCTECGFHRHRRAVG